MITSRRISMRDMEEPKPSFGCRMAKSSPVSYRQLPPGWSGIGLWRETPNCRIIGNARVRICLEKVAGPDADD
jgi:hypothetical protein